jgi:hypothetical protein
MVIFTAKIKDKNESFTGGSLVFEELRGEYIIIKGDVNWIDGDEWKISNHWEVIDVDTLAVD